MSRSSTVSTDNDRDARKINIFGSTEPVSRWVPLTMLAVSTVALVAPVILFKRYKSGQKIQQANVPPRRGGAGPYFSLERPAHDAMPIPSALPPSLPLKARVTSEGSGEDSFNAPLYTFKAFSIATALVTTGAIVSMWGIKTLAGASDTKQFADRMRHAVLTKMPILSSRIHRPPEEDSEEQESEPSQSNTTNSPVEWNWSDAEQRLKNAFDRGGFYGWATAAVDEVEAEAHVERAKRRLVYNEPPDSRPS
ncbi:hypothetical protein BJ138DRAFT_1151759 [Hygrophoropsis aurantiaca]|uniref:Uncharacterized protein n=1 Tax=Hygrophoropsis aurantiaca TaxID=72124 RepID=A0ACB8ABT4_9AGAM|nr:hypothetical protein BJ138DRAFT_1151759 [Hygrophoropsis aurantiaca]